MYADLEEILQCFIKRKLEERMKMLTRSKMKLGAIAPDGADVVLPKIEPVKYRAWPKLFYDNGEPINQLHFSNLPTHINTVHVENLLRYHGITPLHITVKRRHSSYNDSIAFVDLNPRDLLHVQIFGHENVLRFGNRVVRVNPAVQKILYFKPATNNDTFLQQLPHEILQIVLPKCIEDQLNLINSSRATAEYINSMDRPLIISPDLTSHESIPVHKFLRLVKPSNLKSNFSKIILINSNLCKNISPDLVSSLFTEHYINHVVEINLTGVQFSPSIINNIKRCEVLQKLQLGASNGPFDKELNNLIKSNHVLKFLSVEDNIFFTSAALKFCENEELKIVEITRCYKLHMQYMIDFMTKSKTLRKLVIKDCRQVIKSPAVLELLRTLPHTSLNEFQLIYTSAQQLPGDVKNWKRLSWDQPAIHLKKLVINGLTLVSLTTVVLQSIIPLLPSLEQLDISGHDFSSNSHIDLPWKTLCSLKELHMNNVKHVPGDFWNTTFTSLQKLELNSCRYINGFEIRKFVHKNFRTLDKIDIRRAKLKNIPEFNMLSSEFMSISRNPITILTNCGLFINHGNIEKAIHPLITYVIKK